MRFPGVPYRGLQALKRLYGNCCASTVFKNFGYSFLQIQGIFLKRGKRWQKKFRFIASFSTSGVLHCPMQETSPWDPASLFGFTGDLATGMLSMEQLRYSGINGYTFLALSSNAAIK
jgi:hypothetical protein